MRGGRFNVIREWSYGAFLCISALGPGLVSGRDIAFFYAQTGRISWLGIVLCGSLFGLFAGLTARTSVKTGAASFPQIFKRSMGVYAGGAVWTMHALALAAAGWLALSALGRYAAFVLPMKSAELAGMIAGLMLAAAASRKECLRKFGLVFGLASAVFLAALLLFGKIPQEARIYAHIKLKLEGSAKGMAALAILHACRCMAVTAGTAAGFAADARPSRLGIAAGTWMCLLLGMGNAVLRRHPQELMALREPFAAMGGEWGKAGYFCASAMLWAGAFSMLAGVIFSVRGLLRAERRNGC